MIMSPFFVNSFCERPKLLNTKIDLPVFLSVFGNVVKHGHSCFTYDMSFHSYAWFKLKSLKDLCETSWLQNAGESSSSSVKLKTGILRNLLSM